MKIQDEKQAQGASNSDANESAFPLSFVMQSRLGGVQQVVQPGMALRDYFAAQSFSVISLIINPNVNEMELVARMAYRLADAMLKVRKEGANEK